MADILQTALGTVKKQVANILFKTGSETRLIAALRAAELLEPGGDSGDGGRAESRQKTPP